MNGGQDRRDRRQAILHSRGWIHVSGMYTYRKKGNSRVCRVQRTGESNGMMLNLFSLVQSLSHVRLFATPWTTACQASLSITNSWILLRPMCIELVMPSSHLIFCCRLLLTPSIFPSIRVFSNESALHIRVAKVLEFQLQNPFFLLNIQDLFPFGWTGWISLQSKGLSRVFANTTVQKHQFFGAQLSSQFNSHIHT